MIRFRLAEQIERKQFSEGRRITIGEVAEATGVNRMTLSKLLNQRGLQHRYRNPRSPVRVLRLPHRGSSGVREEEPERVIVGGLVQRDAGYADG